MPQTVYDETYDQKGKLLERTERIIPDPDPTPEERIAILEQKLSAVSGTLDAVSKAGSFEAAKVEIATRIDIGEIVLPADGELVEAVR